MKKLRSILILSALYCSVAAIAQENLNNGLLFGKFMSGTVIYKNMTQVSALLNYNSVEEEMLFKTPDNSIMALDNPSSVAAIVIGNRRFVYAQKDAFYEEISAGKDNSFYILWKSKLISQGKGSAYGGRSGASAITNIGSHQGRGADYSRLNLDEKFETKTEQYFYLKINDKYKLFNSAKSLGKLFKGHEAEIEEFAKQQNTDFKKTSDIAEITEYCYSLSKE
jgi:hypothetical protein